LISHEKRETVARRVYCLLVQKSAVRGAELATQQSLSKGKLGILPLTNPIIDHDGLIRFTDRDYQK